VPATALRQGASRRWDPVKSGLLFGCPRRSEAFCGECERARCPADQPLRGALHEGRRAADEDCASGSERATTRQHRRTIRRAKPSSPAAGPISVWKTANRRCDRSRSSFVEVDASSRLRGCRAGVGSTARRDPCRRDDAPSPSAARRLTAGDQQIGPPTFALPDEDTTPDRSAHLDPVAENHHSCRKAELRRPGGVM